MGNRTHAKGLSAFEKAETLAKGGLCGKATGRSLSQLSFVKLRMQPYLVCTEDEPKDVVHGHSVREVTE